MFDQFSNLENKTQEYNYSNDKSINLVIQFMVDGYLKRNEQPSMKELLAADNIEDKPGVVLNYHIAFIQAMILEELAIVGLDLTQEIQKNGEKFEWGNLSQYESKYLSNKMENVVGLVDVIREKLTNKLTNI